MEFFYKRGSPVVCAHHFGGPFLSHQVNLSVNPSDAELGCALVRQILHSRAADGSVGETSHSPYLENFLKHANSLPTRGFADPRVSAIRLLWSQASGEVLALASEFAL